MPQAFKIDHLNHHTPNFSGVTQKIDLMSKVWPPGPPKVRRGQNFRFKMAVLGVFLLTKKSSGFCTLNLDATNLPHSSFEQKYPNILGVPQWSSPGVNNLLSSSFQRHPKSCQHFGSFWGCFFMKTIFLVKRLVFAYHDVHIRKAMPKLDRLRYFGTLFVHSVMRQIFVNTVQWDWSCTVSYMWLVRMMRIFGETWGPEPD